jgi:hypothetical protein
MSCIQLLNKKNGSFDFVFAINKHTLGLVARFISPYPIK